MKLELENDMTIAEVKQSFNQTYPNLKIEFYSMPHGTFEGSDGNLKLADDIPIKQIAKPNHPAALLFTNGNTVSQIEQMLRNSFGLNTQIFRKAGNIWLQTIATDDWTLKQQNEKSQEYNVD